MALQLQLETGKIKEYRTYWMHYNEPGINSDQYHYTKCGLHFKDTPLTGACDHIDCAIHAAKEKAMGPLVMILIFSCWMVGAGWYEGNSFLTTISDYWGFFLFCGIIFIPFSIRSFKTWLELTEFKKNGTIHGVRAHRI